MSPIQLIDPTKIPHWDDLISCHPAASPFHSSGWARVLRDTYAFTPYYACVFKGETLSACLPLMEVNSFLTGKRGVSLPFTDFCAPLLNGTVSSRELMEFAIQLGRDRHWKYLELRSNDFLAMQSIDGRWKMEDGSNSLASPQGDGREKREDGSNSLPSPNNTPSLHYSNTPKPPYSNFPRLAINSTNSTTSPKFSTPDTRHPTPSRGDGRWKMEDGSKDSTPSPGSYSSLLTSHSSPKESPGAYASYSHHILDLSLGQDELYRGLRDSTRRNIRKAEKEGVTVRFATDLEAVKTYFRLHCLTRKRHGVPPQPWAFFENIHRHLISAEKGFVALADYQGREIAGAVYLTFGDSALYKFGASDLSYQHLRANNSAMWMAIRSLAEKGFKTLSFGRTEPENQGLIQFKSGWGAVEESLDYFRYDFGACAFISGNGKGPAGYEKVFQKLPEPALRLMGKVLYRHFGS